MKNFKTLEEIGKAYPLKMKYAMVQILGTTDYNMGRVKTQKVYSHEKYDYACVSWRKPLDYIKRKEIPHYSLNKELFDGEVERIMSSIPEEVVSLLPDIKEVLTGALEDKIWKELDKSPFIETVIEHQTAQILQVYIPSYRAEYMGQKIEVDAELLWEAE